MDKYAVVFRKSALKELRKLPKEAVAKLYELISGLADDPRPAGCKKLKGFQNLWRVRSGDYRVIYSIEDGRLIVEIVRVRDRKDAY